MTGRWPFLLLALSSSAALAQASNDFAYDIQLAKLGNPQAGGFGYNPRADSNFRVFARQLAAAITSANGAPPETLGHSGFAMTAELSLASLSIPAAGDYRMPTAGTYQDFLKIPSLHLRKGLPASFEIGARGAWIEQSRMGAATLEVKWAINEGFTYFPDIGIRGSVTKVINGRDFDLTTGGLDLGIGKQFALGGMVTLTPYLGWNLMFVGATTNSVDFHPSRSLEASETASEQFTDFYVFSSLQASANAHNRFYGGARFVAGVVQLGAEVSYSLIGRFRDTKTNEDREVPSVLAINVMVGLDF